MRSRRGGVERGLVLAIASFAGACATLVSGSREEITIRTEPAGAKVMLTPGYYEVTTPATLDLPRRDAPYLVSVTLEGYESQRSYVRAEPNLWLWGNLLLGGPIGITVDWAYGAINDLEPDTIDLELAPEAAARPAEEVPE